MSHSPAFTIRHFQPTVDAHGVHALWQACFGGVFPIDADLLQRVLTDYSTYLIEDHAVATVGRQLVGLVCTQSHTHNGQITAVAVHPSFRNIGIGSSLIDAAVRRLHAKGANRIQLGGGASRFWPGVPSMLPNAIRFFQRRGWFFSEISFDLVMHLEDYEPPAWVYERIRRQQVELSVGKQSDEADVLSFELREHPNWSRAFQTIFDAGDYHDILIAHNAQHEVVGTLAMFSRTSRCPISNFVWREKLGENMGGIGAVGVAERERGKGIGMAMVARACEILKERGVGNSTACWTWLVEWYGKLGFKPWQEYQMCWREYDMHSSDD